VSVSSLPGIAERSAQLVLVPDAEIPQEVIEYAKELVLGCIGAAIAGTRLPAGRILLEHAEAEAARGDSVIYLTGRRSSLETAALVNNTLWHATELEGNSYPEVVSIYTLVPPLLAVGDTVNASGEEVLTAAILGHELQARLGLAANRDPNSPTSFHYMNMQVMGGLAVAAGAARLLGVALPATAAAISLAASQACGIVRQTGTMAHYVESGLAGRAGVTAALLARRGLTANLNIIETPGGLLDIAGADRSEHIDAIFEDWGNPFRVREEGEKTYPCCYLMQHILEQVRAARLNDGFSADDVVGVAVEINSTHGRICRFDSPETGEQAHFSIPHGIAVALLDDEPSVAGFETARVHAPEVRELRERVTVSVRDDWEDGTLAQPHPVEVHLRDGRHLRLSAEKPSGHPPAYLDRSALIRKFRACSGPVLDDMRAQRIEDTILDLERLDRASELTQMLLPPPP
jgi:2-methylcitrate dehydratase